MELGKNNRKFLRNTSKYTKRFAKKLFLNGYWCFDMRVRIVT